MPASRATQREGEAADASEAAHAVEAAKTAPRWIGFASGVVAGATGVLVGHAFDTLKVQAQVGNAAVVRSPAQLLMLYRGILPPLLTTGAMRSLYFGVYECVRPATARLRQAISERVVPMIAVLAEICPGIGELMNGGNDRYGLRGAESLEAAQAQFLPKDFFPSSSYTKATKGAYATGCAVSTEVSVEAAARVDEEVTDDDAASNGAKAKHLRFTKAIEVFVEKDEVSKFLVFSYPGIGTQGGSSIDKRARPRTGSLRGWASSRWRPTGRGSRSTAPSRSPRPRSTKKACLGVRVSSNTE